MVFFLLLGGHGAHRGLSSELGLTHTDGLGSDGDKLIIANPRDTILESEPLSAVNHLTLLGTIGGVGTHTALLFVLLADIDTEILELGLGVLTNNLAVVDLITGENEEASLAVVASKGVLLHDVGIH